jgi:L-asparagine oxygenase
MTNELHVDHVFEEPERQALVDAFLGITVSPYKMYPAFREQIRDVGAHLPELRRLRDFIEYTRSISAYEHPFLFLRNAPLDPDLPEMDTADPVFDKYRKKKTFVTEGFLQLFADLAGQHPIGYRNVNDGDVFQDIFPKDDLKYTQSQKALGPIYFHKDLANHFVRPDYVNIVGVRSSDQNEILTTFVSNRDLLEHLTPKAKRELRRAAYHTPYDDLTTMTGNVKLGEADTHPVYSGTYDLRYFENRTRGLDADATAAIEELLALAHHHKQRVLMRPGDFVCIANNLSLHGKEIGQIRSPAEQLRRWSMKTVNVYSIAPHARHLVRGTDYLING